MWAVEGYEPLAELGRGSTGLVTRARDSATGTVVAVRRLAIDLCDSPAFLVRYRGEVAILGLIEHPQVAGVYELVERDGAVDVVTEFVDGVSLRDLLDRTGPLEPEAALYVVKGVLLGLREVHACTIVHRALRPENVLIDSAATVKIVDIGLTPPSRNRVPANPTYAAPELWSGGEPTSTSDVYAAATILFECLGGLPPRSLGGTVAGSALTADAAIAALRPDRVPEPIRGFLKLALAADPSVRPADAAAALEGSDIAAFSAFGSRWYDTGHALVRQRLAHAQPRTEPGNGATAIAPSAPPAAVPGNGTAAAKGNGTAAAKGNGTAAIPAAPPAVPAAVPVVASGAAAVASTGGRAAIAPVYLPAAPVRPPGQDGPPPDDARPAPGAHPPRPPRGRSFRLLIGIAVLLLAAAGSGLALTAAFGPDDSSPGPVTTNSHVPVAVPGPTVPPTAPGSGDTTKPTAPAGLRVTGRSLSAVSMDWADALDNVGVAGYVVYRDGTQVGTSYQPGFTDQRLTSRTRYRYAVAAFDAAGNVSAPSAAVTATTLAEPDVSPPTVPQKLEATSRGMTRIVLGWDASQDNVGVAGYEVYRDGALVANVPRPGYTDRGLAPGTKYRYTVRAFDTSNNASADSNLVAPTTLDAPDTTPPSPPGGVAAAGASPTTIDVSWTASLDNVGVALYRVHRNGVPVADVMGTAFTDMGLAPSTSYEYSVRAVDAEGNQSAFSATATASTLDPPPPPTTPPPPTSTTPPPTVDPPRVESVTLVTTIAGCSVSIQATVEVSAPMDVTLTYTVTGHETNSVELHFTGPDLSQTLPLPDGDRTDEGDAIATAADKAATFHWDACEPEPPPTTEPPVPPDEV